MWRGPAGEWHLWEPRSAATPRAWATTLRGGDPAALVDRVAEGGGVVERGGLAILLGHEAAPLRRQPVLVVLRLEDDHLAPHDRVPRAAVLRAEDLVAARRGRVEPDLRVPPGEHVHFDAELGDEEGVDHVARG